MIFFADENISDRLVKMIELFDPAHSLRAFKEWFAEGTPDTVWIPEIGRWDPKPIVLCGDGRILSNKAEKTALRAADVTFVLLAKGWTQMPWHDLAWKMLRVWPAIVQDVERARKPTIFTVTVNLKVERTGLISELR